MSTKRTGLGRSLSALLQATEDADEQKQKDAKLLILPIESLQAGKYQPRGSMDDAALEALADSIAAQGILQPIVVRKLENSYEIIAGERRWRAAKRAQLTEVPTIVRDVGDETAMALALIENLQREALNVMDEARALERLSVEFGLTHQDIAKILSKSRTAVTNLLRLLQLDDEVKNLLEAEKLDMGHARCLLSLPADQQKKLARLIVEQGLSVRKAEALAASFKQEKTTPPVALKPSDTLRQAFDGRLDAWLKATSTTLGAPVQIKSNAAGDGQLLIKFKGADELKRLLEQLKKEAELTEAI